MRNRSSLAAAVAMVLGTSAANAAVDDMFSVRGYGTAGVTYSSLDSADFVRDIYAMRKGAGRTESVSAAVDSKTAIQVDMRFTDRFSAVVQLVSEGLYNSSWDGENNDEWTPSLEWANLSYRITDNLTVRGGRIVMPTFMHAEYQKVGYASHWMRAPLEVYGKFPFTNVDGGDISYKMNFGNAVNTVRGYYGGQATRMDPVVKANTDMWGVVDTFELGSLTVRASYTSSTFRNLNTSAARAGQLGGVANIFAAAAAQAALAGGTTVANAANAAAAQLRELAVYSHPDHEHTTEVVSLGAIYDPGSWFVVAEVTDAKGSAMAPSHTAGYVSGGVRISQFTPYATYSLTDAKPFEEFIPTAGPTPQLAAVANAVNLGDGSWNGGLMRSDNFAQDQSTVSLGLRWDAASNIAVKAQYDYIMLPKDSSGMFVNRTAEFENGRDVSVFGLSLDFLF